MTNFIKITEENVFDYPAGTTVEVSYGAMFPTVPGVIKGFARIPKDRFRDERYVLLVELTKFDDDGEVAGTENQIFEQIALKGIGMYIIKVPEKKANPKSKWAQYP